MFSLTPKPLCMEHKIDATDKILGRLATEVAILLRGKKDPSFDPARLAPRRVVVYNTDKVRVTGKKMEQKLYRRHSGYPGALKEEKLKDLLRRDSRQVVEQAVAGMLPKNRSRKRFLRNLVLWKGDR